MKFTRFSDRLTVLTLASVLAVGMAVAARCAAPAPDPSPPDPFSFTQFAATAWAADYTVRVERYARDLHDYRAAFETRDKDKITDLAWRTTDDMLLLVSKQEQIPKILAVLPPDERPKFQALADHLWKRALEAKALNPAVAAKPADSPKPTP